MLLVLVSCMACRPGTTDDGDSELWTAAGCETEAEVMGTIGQGITTMPTVLDVRWDEPIEASVVFKDLDSGRVMITPTTDTGWMLLLGLRQNTDVEYRVVMDQDGEVVCSEPREAHTGGLPSSLPALSVSIQDAESYTDGWVAVAVYTENGHYAAIIDREGEYVWAVGPPFVRDQISRAVLSKDRKHVLLNRWASSSEEIGAIVQVPIDGRETTETMAKGIHTDFLEMDDGGFAAIGWEVRDFEEDEGTRHILGNTLVELNGVDEPEVVFDMFDHFDPDLDNIYPPSDYEEDVEDWSHLNGLSYDEDSSDYFISLFGLDAVARIDGATGAPEWVLSDFHGDFTIEDDETLIHSSHSVEYLGDDRLLVFNRSAVSPLRAEIEQASTGCSEAVEIQLDLETGSASRVWSYATEECMPVIFLGQATRLDDGNTLVLWSSAGQMDEVTPDGESVWRVNTRVGGAIGFGGFVDSFYAE
ncbi:MAG TPA: aryl-sulfate sulfotransferase [Myxococcota bacterium]|nr:aryl-sulfate sulfotransferase [Myxococcota bacterium]